MQERFGAGGMSGFGEEEGAMSRSRKRGSKKRRGGGRGAAPRRGAFRGGSPPGAPAQEVLDAGVVAGGSGAGGRRVVLILVLVVVLGLTLGWWWRRRAASHDGPLILISLDTLRQDRLSVGGYPEGWTPALERLAREGITFSGAHSQVPLTLPSHASIFTGLAPIEHGVRNNAGFQLDTKHSSVVRELRDAGYGTAGFVSAFVLRPSTGIDQGFQHYDANLGSGVPQQSMAEVRREGKQTVDAALEWLDRQEKKRFFLFVHLYDPHLPHRPPWPWNRVLANGYDGEIAHVSAQVDRLLERLREKGFYDDSLILLISDHGEGFGDHGEEEHGIFLYREAIDVPMILKLPGNRQAGRLVPAPVGLVDVAATFRDWAGLPEVRQEGRSLLDTLAGTVPPGRRIYSETLYPRYHYGWKELYSLRDERFTYILAPREELYDRAADPGEHENRLAWEGRRRERFQSELEEFLAEERIAAPQEVSAEEARAMEALGYVGAPALVEGSGDLPDPKDRIDDFKRYLHAANLIAQRRFSEALPLLRGVLDANPAMVEAWDRMSLLSERLGDLDGAFKAQKRSLELAPMRVASLLQMSHILELQGRHEEAIQHAELAAGKDPGKGFSSLARLYAFRGESYKALEAAGKAARENPAILPFIEGLVAHHQRRFDDARLFLEQAVKMLESESKPYLLDLNFYLADCLGRAAAKASGASAAELAKQAEKRFRLELENFPENLSAALRLAALYMTQGRTKERDNVLGTLAKNHPSPDTYGAIADAYRLFGDLELAARFTKLSDDSKRASQEGEARLPGVAELRNEKQNVLLITIDTLRGDALGCYGGGATTPVLDGLAASGLKYTFAHAPTVMTLPSHTSILTGLYPEGHGVHDNSGFRLGSEIPTLATIFSQRGMATGAFVSAATLDARFGLGRGFDVYDEGYPEQAAQGRMAVPERRGEETVAAARKWIESQNGQWFCWVHLFDPHAPYDPPPGYGAGSDDRGRYLGEVAYVDAALKPLVGLAQKSKPGTLILVTSDHGESLGEHGELTHGLFAYESTLRVPLLLWNPEIRRAGVVDAPVGLVDVAPTLLELLGIEPPKAWVGRSLLRPSAERELAFETLHTMLTRGWAPLRGLLAGRWKAIDLPIPELYNLRPDPAEQENLASRDPRRLERLLRRARTFSGARSRWRRRLQTRRPSVSSRPWVMSQVVRRRRSAGHGRTIPSGCLPSIRLFKRHWGIAGEEIGPQPLTDTGISSKRGPVSRPPTSTWPTPTARQAGLAMPSARWRRPASDTFLSVPARRSSGAFWWRLAGQRRPSLFWVPAETRVGWKRMS